MQPPPIPDQLDKPTAYTDADLRTDSIDEIQRKQGEMRALRDSVMIYLHIVHRSEDSLVLALESRQQAAKNSDRRLCSILGKSLVAAEQEIHVLFPSNYFLAASSP